MDKSEATALIKELNKASEAYYNTGHPIMSDYDFDKKNRYAQKMGRRKRNCDGGQSDT